MDTDAGTLKFWRDGKPHSPGYTSGVSGPLRWAATVGYTYSIRRDRAYARTTVALWTAALRQDGYIHLTSNQ